MFCKALILEIDLVKFGIQPLLRTFSPIWKVVFSMLFIEKLNKLRLFPQVLPTALVHEN